MNVPEPADAARSEPPNRDALQAELDAARETIASLSHELEETNQGVMALYSELESQAEELRQASELKSRFLSYLSHEFRTPLSSIRSIARILLDRLDGELTDEQEKQVRFMQASASELTEMIDDLLDLAKVEAGRITVSAEWFEMVDLFSALRGMFKPLATSENVTLIFDEIRDFPPLYTDDQKLSQILRNFISNALKFTKQGFIKVTATVTTGDMVTFAVQDTGIGIPADFLPQIFRDYVQVDSAIQKRLRGTGLGLSLSRRLAQLLGGDVAVHSELGVGSTFAVTIPTKLPAQPSATNE